MNPTLDRARLAALRDRRGWSQEELARAAGLSTRTVQRLESGAAASLETRKALAAAFDVELDELVARTEPGSARDSGVRWGIGCALAGYSLAAAAVVYTASMGYMRAGSAGRTLGILGAVVGTLCGLIGWHSRTAREAGRGA
ncbi:MAG: helix-turn-helix transcriptional regulator [Myxococcales bacterium]|nr:helix-turn-helix transcriptional regulator [Myxococcales bacterium]